MAWRGGYYSGSFFPKPWLLLCLCVQVVLHLWIAPARGEDIHRLCEYTRFPRDCVDALLPRQQSASAVDDVSTAALALVDTIMEEMTKPGLTILSLEASEAAGAAEAVEYCKELMEMSFRRLNQTMKALKSAPSKKKEDIRTWLSAVITFQETCKDAAEELPSHQSKLMSTKMKSLAALSSNALALANRIPKTSVDESSLYRSSEARLPSWVTKKNFTLLASADTKASAVVAADGSGDFTSVMEALDATASQDGRRVILIKAGFYKEKIRITHDDVTLVGEGKYSTIISHDSSVGGGTNMPDTATVVVTGDRFMAMDIGFVNSAGPYKGQALALRLISDRAVLFRCSIQGYQDTLFAQSLRQFYRDCDIMGTIDFIFGNAAAFFQNCNLIFRRPRTGAFNAMMANGRTDPGQNTGFVAQKCNVQAGSDLFPTRYSVRSYLGRPWKKYSRAVIIQSNINNFIQPEGWSEWSGGFALHTLYFAEGLNAGGGAGTSGRVSWPGFHLISAAESSDFTVSNFIQGSSWIPSTGVTYVPGL
ncbi:pectinesterase 2-like [Wolffia australiana]